MSCLGFLQLLLLADDVAAHHLRHLLELIALLLLLLQSICDELCRLQDIGLTIRAGAESMFGPALVPCLVCFRYCGLGLELVPLSLGSPSPEPPSPSSPHPSGGRPRPSGAPPLPARSRAPAAVSPRSATVSPTSFLIYRPSPARP